MTGTRVVPVLMRLDDEAVFRAYLDERHSLDAQTCMAGIDADGRAFVVWLMEQFGVTTPVMMVAARSVTEPGPRMQTYSSIGCRGALAFPVHLAVQMEVGA